MDVRMYVCMYVCMYLCMNLSKLCNVLGKRIDVLLLLALRGQRSGCGRTFAARRARNEARAAAPRMNFWRFRAASPMGATSALSWSMW